MSPEELAKLYEQARNEFTDEELEAARNAPGPWLTTEELFRRLNARLGTNAFQQRPD